MLNRPWIDPRDVDWTDALNGLRNPGWSPINNPFVWAAYKDPMFQALRQAKGIEPRIYVGPDPAHQAIDPGVTQDYEVASEPNCWLWGLSSSATGGGGAYLVNVSDSVTGAKLFSQPVDGQALAQKTSGRGPLFVLSTPHLFVPPAYPIIRVINTDAARQTIRVNLFCAVEYDV